MLKLKSKSTTSVATSKQRGLWAVVGVLALVPLLNACTGLLVGGAIAGGALVGATLATERRSSGAMLDDEGIEQRARARFRDQMPMKGNITATSFNRRVLITGQVGNQADKDMAERIARELPNVGVVLNELELATETRSATQAAKDSLVTSKIKAKMAQNNLISSNNHKVVTENGVVYLMGIVTQQEADLATEIARVTPDVTRVVKHYQLVTDAAIVNK